MIISHVDLNIIARSSKLELILLSTERAAQTLLNKFAYRKLLIKLPWVESSKSLN